MLGSLLTMESERLNELIDSLDGSVNSAGPFKTKWRPIWEDIKEIGAAFKETRYPTKEERQEKWQRFQALVQKVKKHQAEEEKKWEERSYSSKQHKNEIFACARAATPAGPLADLVNSIVSLPALPVKAALDAILPSGEIDEKHEELKACSEKLEQGWGLLSEYKLEMTGHDKKEAFDALKDAQENLNGAWAQWKKVKSQAWEAHKEHFQEKREAFKDRVRERIENLKERLEHEYSKLAKAEAHLDKLRDDRDSAWNDDFRERVEGWIEEEEERREQVKEKITRIEGWLDEERNKLE